MPIFHIVYTDERTNHLFQTDTDWITEGHWDAERTEQCFKERFPTVTVVQIKDITEEFCSACPSTSNIRETTTHSIHTHA
jgi:hypothetical protein